MITFFAADGTVVSEYPTMRSHGRYYIQDLHFVPATRRKEEEEPDTMEEHVDPNHGQLDTGRITMVQV